MNIVLDTNCLLMIVTQDHHYDILRQIPFPRIEVVDIDEFLNMLR